MPILRLKAANCWWTLPRRLGVVLPDLLYDIFTANFELSLSSLGEFRFSPETVSDNFKQFYGF